MRAWTSVEINGWVNIWYHAEGIEPDWRLPELQEITDGTWQYKGRTEHYINAHIEVSCNIYLRVILVRNKQSFVNVFEILFVAS